DAEGEYRENPMSDDARAYIRVWMETEDEGKQDAEPQDESEDYQTAHREASDAFNKYRHHYFEDGVWKTYSEKDLSSRKDEEWFIPSPPILQTSDPEYLCEMCRQIDFAVLLTLRGVPGNNEPGSSVIDIKGAISRVFEENNCSFCGIIRQGIQGRCAPEDLELAKNAERGKMRLAVLDDGPEYALRLEVSLENLAPRLVLQILAPDDAQAALPLQGLVVQQGNADMKRLRHWIQNCEEHHHHGEDVSTSKEEPSSWRFIDVEECRIVLVDTPCRYACLSYVWGNEKGTQLTTETLSTLESPGGLNDASVCLGKTLSDAIKVTKDIGIRYLWIDALCIVQDDAADKKSRISHMSDIYGNATITIVASTNSRPAEGLPGAGDTSRTQAQVVGKLQGITLIAAFHDARLPHKDIEESAWNSRAWTFQERQLSPRAVYFTGSQMHFTCPHEVVFEDTVAGLSANHRPAHLLDHSQFLGRVHDLMHFICWQDPTQYSYPNKTFHIKGLGSESISMMTSDTSIPAPIYRATPVPRPGGGGGTLQIHGETMWKVYSDAVSMYTRRKMSFQTDALNAFHGVSDLIAQGINSAFWHGLPEYNFDQALLWYPQEPLTRRTHENASPSWSWAGWEGHTAYRRRGWRNAIAHTPATVVRWFYLEHPREVIYNYLVNGEHHTPEEIADFAFHAAREPAEILPLRISSLFHFHPNDGWKHCRDTDRNEHYYTHPEYPGLRFTYPTTLPSQKIIPRLAPNNGIFFLGRHVPVRFVDIANTPHNPAPRVDPFLQINIRNIPKYGITRFRPWERVIYHQGYRAGFLSLNVPFSSLDISDSDDPAKGKYHIVPLSRESVPSIAPPIAGWDAYWDLTPRNAQNLVIDWEWGPDEERLPVLGPHEDAGEPERGARWENGDAYWDVARFGAPFMFSVYNVLLLEKVGERVMDGWRRVGVGKMNAFAFWHASPEEDMFHLR
ncbi:heterokaryon incompatibility protein-domain-containing protein, partial [Cercophora newfieldiana]